MTFGDGLTKVLEHSIERRVKGTSLVVHILVVVVVELVVLDNLERHRVLQIFLACCGKL